MRFFLGGKASEAVSKFKERLESCCAEALDHKREATKIRALQSPPSVIKGDLGGSLAT
jgi:hypothetical protein